MSLKRSQQESGLDHTKRQRCNSNISSIAYIDGRPSLPLPLPRSRPHPPPLGCIIVWEDECIDCVNRDKLARDVSIFEQVIGHSTDDQVITRDIADQVTMIRRAGTGTGIVIQHQVNNDWLMHWPCFSMTPFNHTPDTDVNPREYRRWMRLETIKFMKVARPEMKMWLHRYLGQVGSQVIQMIMEYSLPPTTMLCQFDTGQLYLRYPPYFPLASRPTVHPISRSKPTSISTFESFHRMSCTKPPLQQSFSPRWIANLANVNTISPNDKWGYGADDSSGIVCRSFRWIRDTDTNADCEKGIRCTHNKPLRFRRWSISKPWQVLYTG